MLVKSSNAPFVCLRGQIRSALMEEVIAVQKMCVSTLMLACSKLVEIYKKHNRAISEPSRSHLKALVCNFKRREIPAFRNKVAGHIWDKDASRPLTASEVIARLEKICSPDMSIFFSWLNDPKGNKSPDNVVAQIEAARNSLAHDFALATEGIVQK